MENIKIYKSHFYTFDFRQRYELWSRKWHTHRYTHGNGGMGCRSGGFRLVIIKYKNWAGFTFLLLDLPLWVARTIWTSATLRHKNVTFSILHWVTSWRAASTSLSTGWISCFHAILRYGLNIVLFCRHFERNIYIYIYIYNMTPVVSSHCFLIMSVPVRWRVLKMIFRVVKYCSCSTKASSSVHKNGNSVSICLVCLPQM